MCEHSGKHKENIFHADCQFANFPPQMLYKNNWNIVLSYWQQNNTSQMFAIITLVLALCCNEALLFSYTYLFATAHNRTHVTFFFPNTENEVTVRDLKDARCVERSTRKAAMLVVEQFWNQRGKSCATWSCNAWTGLSLDCLLGDDKQRVKQICQQCRFTNELHTGLTCWKWLLMFGEQCLLDSCCHRGSVTHFCQDWPQFESCLEMLIMV